jgi:protein CpxP
MKKTITAAVAVLTLTASLAIAGPGREGRGHGKHGGEFSEKFAQKLNLTDAQKQQIKSLRESFRTENEPQRNQMRQLTTDLRAAREANDTARAATLASQIEAQRATFKQRSDAQRDRVLSVLTADQRAQYEAMKAEHKAKRGDRKNKQ